MGEYLRKRTRKNTLIDKTQQQRLQDDALQQRLEAHFYANGSGREPVREWIKSFQREDMRDIGFAVSEVQLGWPIGMPLVRKLEEGLWEIRINISQGRIARIIFTVVSCNMYLLHAFIKKTQKTPPHDLGIARLRRDEVQGE